MHMSNEPLAARPQEAFASRGDAPVASPADFDRLPDPGRLQQLLVAIACSLGALAVRWMLDPWLGDRQPYTPAFAAIAIAGWYGTWRAGLLAALLTNLSANYFFVAARGHFTVSMTEAVGSASFFLIALVILYLGHRAREANMGLRAANLRLRDADRHRSEFLATLAHELRSPLAAIRTASFVLGSRKASAEEAARATAALERQLDHCVRRMDDLMDASRLEQGTVVLHRRPVPLRKVLETALDAAQPHIAHRGQRVQVDAPPDMGEIVADEARLVQVLTNLLHNAAKFSPAGAVVAISLQRRGDEVCIRIVDQGQGIPPDRVEWIFDTFSQLQPGHEGLGLGLALVRRLVEMHGGTVCAQSAGVGKGATFEVRLPA